MTLLFLPLFFLALFQQGDGGDAVTELENRWVRVVRVHYTPHQKTGVHDHPAQPTVYIYVTDGGRLKIGHEGEPPVIRPPVKSGAIRFQKGVAERHAVEELDGVESEYLRVELKTEPVDLPAADVRRSATDRTPFESGMLRILRVTCPAHNNCPASGHPEFPAVIVTGRKAEWAEANAAPFRNNSDVPVEQVRIELKTPPL